MTKGRTVQRQQSSGLGRPILLFSLRVETAWAAIAAEVRLRLADLDNETEATFLRCLHDEAPEDPRVIGLRRLWYEAGKARGLRAKVLKLDSGEVIGLCQYMPVEETHIIGRDLVAILCIWIHGYEHHVGNRQGNGYGRLILRAIEDEARGSGLAGVAAWGMDFPYWNPVSFYEHMGYTRVDRAGMAVLVWKPFADEAAPPQFHHPVRKPGPGRGKVGVTVFLNGWCTGACSQCVTAREAIEGLERIVDYRELDTSDPEVLAAWGISNGIYVEGEPYRPYEPPCSSDLLRNDILDLARRKGLRP